MEERNVQVNFRKTGSIMGTWIYFGNVESVGSHPGYGHLSSKDNRIWKPLHFANKEKQNRTTYCFSGAPYKQNESLSRAAQVGYLAYKQSLYPVFLKSFHNFNYEPKSPKANRPKTVLHLESDMY